MPRRGSEETNLLVQGKIDARALAKIVEYYKSKGETGKVYNMSTLLRAIINDWAALCTGENITNIGFAIDVLEGEKLIPRRSETLKRLANAEVHQARTEQRADGFVPTKMEKKQDKASMIEMLANQAYKKFLEEQKKTGKKETFSERMARLKQEADENRKIVPIIKVDEKDIK